jgi:Ca-activated chloride channel family protein
MVLALAGPRWPDLKTRLEAEGIAILMILDTSGSMAERDFDWYGEQVSRLEAVQRAFRLFVEGGTAPDGRRFEGRPTDLVGLVVFGTRPDCICPLTLSHAALLRLLDAQRPRHIPGEAETNISDALALGLHRLQAAGKKRKAIVLLTDGEHNVVAPESGWTPRQAGRLAESLGIPIYTIDSGSDSAGEDPEIRAAAVQVLASLAERTGGQAFNARDTAALLAACHAIDREERTRTPSFFYRRYHEAYPWLALASFVGLTLTWTLESTIWRRLP